MFDHPCKTCISRPVCTKSCEDYKEYDSLFESLIYLTGMVLSIFFHGAIIYIIFKYAEHPKTGVFAYWGAFYLVMFFMIKRQGPIDDPNTPGENIILWGGLPIWLTTMAPVLFCELVGWNEYPKKYNPYYRKIKRINHEKSEKEKSNSRNASAC